MSESETKIYFRTDEEVESDFTTDRNQGLSEEKVQERLKKYGENRLEEKSSVTVWEIFIRQFKSIVMLLLTAAAVASFFIGETVEAIAVLVVILITAVFGLTMEYKAGKSIEALQNTVDPEGKVIRDGEVIALSTKYLVPGDVVLLEEGDQIPADGRLIEADELAVDEAMLTGESDPVRKHTEALEKEEKTALADRKNMVFMGSAILKGSGKYVVTATGGKTEVGAISSMLQETEDEVTPLERRLEQTGRYLIVLTIVITAIVAVIGYLTGRSLEEMLKTSIALAIAAVPEGLPAVATITLAIGMNRMVKKRALVRNLPAVETLGSATVICTDKTGTLTENRMTLQRIYMEDRKISLSGTGYAEEGEFTTQSGETLDPKQDESLRLFLRTGLLCSDAELSEDEEGESKLIGDPTEGALVVGAMKAGLYRKEMDKEFERVNVMPFDSSRKFMAVECRNSDGDHEIFLKGAPGVVIEMCDRRYTDHQAVDFSMQKKEELLEENTKLAKDSFRVLALAYKERRSQEKLDLKDEVESGMVFLGFAGMMDPPRKDIKESISQAKKAGIRTIMLTGDQRDTAIGIARSIGIEVNEDKMLKDQAMEDLTMEELEENLFHNSIYARVTPKNKLDIIRALKNRGEIVAMTGDGVNDAPALKKSDIGIAMGIRGTDVAKEASDMILMDDRFSTIVEAVRQGRVIFDNIQKFIHYLLSCNLSEILLVFLSILFGVPVPLVALQILWLNVVTGVFPAMAMAWEVPEEGVMERKPRDPKAAIITNRYKFLIGFQGLMLAAGPLAAYLLSLNEADLSEARTVGFMTLAMVHLMQVFNVRRKNGLGFDRTFFRNPYLIGAMVLTFVLQLGAVYLPVIQSILRTVPVSMDMWVYVGIGTLLPVAALQIIAFISEKREG